MKRVLFFIFVLFLLIGIAGALSAQEKNPESKVDAMMERLSAGIETKGVSEESARAQEIRVKMIFVIIIASTTILALFLTLIFMWRSRNCSAIDLFHAATLILVIEAILFVVVAAFRMEQLNTAIGALAAIAGYLFGRTTGPGSADGGKRSGAEKGEATTGVER